jgi:hypothetical protein
VGIRVSSTGSGAGSPTREDLRFPVPSQLCRHEISRAQRSGRNPAFFQVVSSRRHRSSEADIAPATQQAAPDRQDVASLLAATANITNIAASSTAPRHGRPDWGFWRSHRRGFTAFLGILLSQA